MPPLVHDVESEREGEADLSADKLEPDEEECCVVRVTLVRELAQHGREHVDWGVVVESELILLEVRLFGKVL